MNVDWVGLLVAVALCALLLWAVRWDGRRNAYGTTDLKDRSSDHRLEDFKGLAAVEGRVGKLETEVRQIRENQETLASAGDIRELKQLINSTFEAQQAEAKRTQRGVDRLEDHLIQKGLGGR